MPGRPRSGRWCFSARRTTARRWSAAGGWSIPCWSSRPTRHRSAVSGARAAPLPAGVEAYAVAATRAPAGAGSVGRAVGDGLVPVASALGLHRDPALALAIPASRQMVIGNANHWDLLSRPEVYAQLLAWLRALVQVP